MKPEAWNIQKKTLSYKHWLDCQLEEIGVVETYCNAQDIPDTESALSWNPGRREEVSWYLVRS